MKTLVTALFGFGFLAYAAAAAEWVVLFDGKLTDKLRGYKQKSFPTNNWVLEGNMLKTVPGDAIDLVTADDYQDFELEFQWKIKAGGNSGVMYRVAEGEDATWYTGPEYQLLDDDKHADGKNPKTTAGSLYALIAPNDKKKLKPVGEFNSSKIVMKSNHVEHWLNGAKVVEYTWGSPEVKELIKGSKFAKLPKFMAEPTGHIAFQHHGDEVWFRKMRIRKL